MSSLRPSTRITPEMSIAAVRLLAQRGYDGVTAEELADAVGMSRSTFFRRFRSKDDVIFTDHDVALERLEAFLRASTLAPVEAVTRGTADVWAHLTRDPEAARLRSELLRDSPGLRERELVISNRYERVFADYLTAWLPASAPEWIPFAAAAGSVAIHNSTLRRWLRDPDPRLLGTLDRDLRAFLSRLLPNRDPAAPPNRVTVAVYETGETPARVLDSIADMLRTH